MAESRNYSFNGLVYTIVEHQSIHEKLTDETYLESYLKENTGSVMIEISAQDKSDNNDKEVRDGMMRSNEKFVWNSTTTKLLVDEYSKRHHLFQDPKTKKILLWREIREAFNKHDHTVTPYALDAKFRNLKHHYKTILHNNKNKIGRRRITWDYFETFQKIFQKGRTLNTTTVTSSFESPLPLPSKLSSPSPPHDPIPDQPILIESKPVSINTNQTDAIPPTPSTSQTSTCFEFVSVSPTSKVLTPLSVDTNISPDCPVTEFSPIIAEHNYVSTSSTTSNDAQNEKIESKRRRSELKARYSFRLKLLEVEEKKVIALEQLTEVLKRHNDIQQERNDLMRRSRQVVFN
nr:uncharacterized protein LOC111429102 [Onthophagus taurus]